MVDRDIRTLSSAPNWGFNSTSAIAMRATSAAGVQTEHTEAQSGEFRIRAVAALFVQDGIGNCGPNEDTFN